MARAKLDPKAVLEIRSRLANNERQKVLAHEYGVAQGVISSIKRRKSWKDVGPQLTGSQGRSP